VTDAPVIDLAAYETEYLELCLELAVEANDVVGAALVRKALEEKERK
jgi:hypothetical protein